MGDLLAVDMLNPQINPVAIRDTGYSAVLRYLRNLTVAEADGYLAAGLGVGTIFETAAAESLGGAAQGSATGATAARQMTALGQAHGSLHVVNLADFAPTPAQVPAISAYWHAYLSQTGPWDVIPYATAWLLQALAVNGWQNAMDDNGVPGDVVSPRAVLYQRVRPTLPPIAGTAVGGYDEDVILANLPWWKRSAPTPPVPVPPGGSVVNVVKPPVAVCAVPGGGDGDYWIACTDGGVVNFGAARFYGSAATRPLAAPVVAMAATPTGHGYWLAGADGGVFTFGDALFYGSLGGVKLAAPVVSITPAPDGKGYWLMGADGGVFTFGTAKYSGRVAVVTSATGAAGLASGGHNPLKALERRVEEIAMSQAELDADVAALNAAVGSLQSAIGDIGTQLSTVATEVTALQQSTTLDLSGLTTAVAAAQALVAAVQSADTEAQQIATQAAPPAPPAPVDPGPAPDPVPPAAAEEAVAESNPLSE